MTIRDIRLHYGLTQKQFADELGIPKRSLEDWEAKRRIPPNYLVWLIEFYFSHK